VHHNQKETSRSDFQQGDFHPAHIASGANGLATGRVEKQDCDKLAMNTVMLLDRCKKR